MDGETNNLEAPEIEGQGVETGNEEAVVETAESTVEEKGIPDDPKLLRAKMTQATQEKSQIEKEYNEFKQKLQSHPRFKEIYDEIETGKKAEAPQVQETVEKPFHEEYAGLTDQQKQIYNTMKPFLSMFMKEMGFSDKVNNFEQFAGYMAKKDMADQQGRVLNDFYSKHPEAKTNPEIDKALANIIVEGAKRGEKIMPETAWKIYTADTAESKAKQKISQEMQEKKEISLLKPTNTSADKIQPNKMSIKKSVEEAWKKFES